MSSVHTLIEAHGIDQARRLVSTAERPMLEAAYAVLADEDLTFGVTHAGFAMTCLPHRKTPEAYWRRESYRITLLVESGRDRSGGLIGVPYGSKARMILCYLQTQAVQKQTRHVELGPSMRAWLQRLGLSIGGATYRLIAEQARRLSACHLTFFWDGDGTQHRRSSSFVRGAISMFGTNPNQPALWQEEVELDPDFYESLCKHAVPLRESALRALCDNSAAIDAYLWLAYRLHALGGPCSVSWPALMEQFGGGYGRLANFKQKWTPSLQLALAVYPEARVDIRPTGLVLHPSHPPVPKPTVFVPRTPAA